MLLKKVKHWGLQGFLQAWKTNHFTYGCYLLQIKPPSPSEQLYDIKESWPTAHLVFAQIFTLYSPNLRFHGFSSALHSTKCTHMIPMGTKTQFFWSQQHKPHGVQWRKIRPYATVNLKKNLLLHPCITIANYTLALQGHCIISPDPRLYSRN